MDQNHAGLAAAYLDLLGRQQQQRQQQQQQQHQQQQQQQPEGPSLAPRTSTHAIHSLDAYALVPPSHSNPPASTAAGQHSPAPFQPYYALQHRHGPAAPSHNASSSSWGSNLGLGTPSLRYSADAPMGVDPASQLVFSNYRLNNDAHWMHQNEGEHFMLPPPQPQPRNWANSVPGAVGGGGAEPAPLEAAAQFNGAKRQKTWPKKKPKKSGLPKNSLAGKSGNLEGAACKTMVTKSGSAVCSLCQINCLTDFALQQHLNGKRHKRQMERHQIKAEVSTTTTHAVVENKNGGSFVDNNAVGAGSATNVFEQMWLQVSMMGKGPKPAKVRSRAKKRVRDEEAKGQEKDVGDAHAGERTITMDIVKKSDKSAECGEGNMETLPEKGVVHVLLDHGIAKDSCENHGFTFSSVAFKGDEQGVANVMMASIANPNNTFEQASNCALREQKFMPEQGPTCILKEQVPSRCDLRSIECKTRAVVESHLAGKTHTTCLQKSYNEQ